MFADYKEEMKELGCLWFKELKTFLVAFVDLLFGTLATIGGAIVQSTIVFIIEPCKKGYKMLRDWILRW